MGGSEGGREGSRDGREQGRQGREEEITVINGVIHIQ